VCIAFAALSGVGYVGIPFLFRFSLRILAVFPPQTQQVIGLSVFLAKSLMTFEISSIRSGGLEVGVGTK